MKRQLGISIYPDHSSNDEDKAYLELAQRYGFSRIFMSMLEVTEGKEIVRKKFTELLRFAKSLSYETILDVAPAIFEELEISYDDLTFFHELGADGIRLDLGFDGSKEAMLTYNPFGLAIELNMSNDVAYLDNILTYQANLPFYMAVTIFILRKAPHYRMSSSKNAASVLKPKEFELPLLSLHSLERSVHGISMTDYRH